MRFRFLIALLLASVPVLAPAEVYRSVDAQGNVVYSDQPGQGGKKVDLPEISTYEPKPVPPGTLDTNAAANQAKANPATQLSFVQPGADETIFDNQGNVAVALRVEPPLQPTQRLALQVDDGAAVETNQPTYQFTGLDRGTHTVHAWVVGADGQTGSPKAAVTFHLRQASTLFRNPAPAGSTIQRAPRAPTAPNVPKSAN